MASIHEVAAGILAAGRKALVPYFMGLWPDAARFHDLVLASAGAGADAVEIGVPFSDPVADGPEIEAAGRESLAGGATPLDVFRETARISARTCAPIVIMTYANPVFRMGPDRFFRAAADAGASGVIIPDAPFEESGRIGDLALSAGVSLISMISVGSGEERIAEISRQSRGFLYLVAVKGVTGTSPASDPDLSSEVAAARRASATPVYAGFGISTPGRAAAAAARADGAVAGSALIAAYRSGGEDAAAGLVSAMRSAMDALPGPCRPDPRPAAAGSAGPATLDFHTLPGYFDPD